MLLLLQVTANFRLASRNPIRRRLHCLIAATLQIFVVTTVAIEICDSLTLIAVGLCLTHRVGRTSREINTVSIGMSAPVTRLRNWRRLRCHNIPDAALTTTPRQWFPFHAMMLATTELVYNPPLPIRSRISVSHPPHTRCRSSRKAPLSTRGTKPTISVRASSPIMSRIKQSCVFCLTTCTQQNGWLEWWWTTMAVLSCTAQRLCLWVWVSTSIPVWASPRPSSALTLWWHGPVAASGDTT